MSGADSMRGVVAGVGAGGIGWLVQFMPPDFVLTRWWPWVVATGGVVILGVLAALIRRRPLVRFVILGAGLVLLSWWLATNHVPAVTPGRAWWPLILAAGLVTVLVAVGYGFQRRGASAGLVGRWSNRSRRNKGVASMWEIFKTSSQYAARRQAAVLRPSYRELSFWQRIRVSTKEFATPIARVGVQRIWSPIEDVTLRIGGPRSGKTGELACRILDAPGAVIATSTRTDLIDLTGSCRERRGRVLVFNPSGVGGLASTVTFDPLSGCQQPKVATTRAADLLAGVFAPGREGGDREFWEGQARRVLAALMHAAALGGASMGDVSAWVAEPAGAAPMVTRFLRRSVEPAYEADAAQFFSMNDRTQSSICATIMPALGWLTDSTAATAASTGGFDVEQLLAHRGTVYMLGAEDAQTAPLVTALTGHIAREARRLAGHQPGGRLDPPLTLALDEAALICPIPLDNWTADMGGRGVTIHIAAQSRAQLRQRWGGTGAAAIMNNAATLLILGGTRDADDLAAYSALTGEREERVPTYDADGAITATTTRRIPVLSAGQIAQLKARHAVIIRRGMAPAVGTVQMAWKRREVKAAQRRLRWGVRLEHWAEARDRVADRLAARLESADERLMPLVERWRRGREATRRPRTRVRTGADARSGEADGWWS